MCGIIGTICKGNHGFERDDMVWFQQTLIVDSLRGLDSTGLFMVDNDQEVQYAKVASHPLRLLQQKRTEEIFNNAVWKGRAMVGHNRKATVGNITNENAHPFVEGHIILVHNGAVHNASEVAKAAGVEVEVDSHVIAHLLATEKDVPAAIAKLRGAFAIVWYNQQDHTLNMVRNDDRPLAFSEGPRGIYFTSEPEMLDWTLGRRPGAAQFTSATMLEPNKVKTFNLSDVTFTEQQAKFKEFTYQSSPTPGTGSTSRYERADGSGHTQQRSVPQESSTGPAAKEGETVAFRITSLEKEMGAAGDTKYKANGVSFQGALFRGFLNPEDTIDRLDLFSPGRIVTARVKHIVYRNGVLATTWVEHIKSTSRTPTQSVGEIKTFNGLRLTQAEWKHICDNKKCSVCNSGLNPAWAKYTSVNTTGKKDDKLICPDCLVQRFQTWGPKEQAWVLQNAAANPLEYLAEKQAIAGPTTLQ